MRPGVFFSASPVAVLGIARSVVFCWAFPMAALRLCDGCALNQAAGVARARYALCVLCTVSPCCRQWRLSSRTPLLPTAMLTVQRGSP